MPGKNILGKCSDYFLPFFGIPITTISFTFSCPSCSGSPTSATVTMIYHQPVPGEDQPIGTFSFTNACCSTLCAKIKGYGDDSRAYVSNGLPLENLVSLAVIISKTDGVCAFNFVALTPQTLMTGEIPLTGGSENHEVNFGSDVAPVIWTGTVTIS